MKYKSEPLSSELEQRIKDRITALKLELSYLRVSETPRASTMLRRIEGNIGALEWVLREAETIKVTA